MLGVLQDNHLEPLPPASEGGIVQLLFFVLRILSPTDEVTSTFTRLTLQLHLEYRRAASLQDGRNEGCDHSRLAR